MARVAVSAWSLCREADISDAWAIKLNLSVAEIGVPGPASMVVSAGKDVTLVPVKR